MCILEELITPGVPTTVKCIAQNSGEVELIPSPFVAEESADLTRTKDKDESAPRQLPFDRPKYHLAELNRGTLEVLEVVTM